VPSALDRPPPLWPFAVHVYALPGVEPLCLRLQDEHGLDVDALLAILWQAHRGAPLDDATLEGLSVAVAPVHARVLELRALRRTLAADRTHEPRWQETYEHLKAAELAAERLELSVLEVVLTSPLPAVPPTVPELATSEPTTAHAGSTHAAPLDNPAPAEPAALAFAALHRHAERCGASACASLLRALVDAVLPRPAPARG
jgi:uncharacterized protein (TIGR02444 family)